jgi:hypothetical protein
MSRSTDLHICGECGMLIRRGEYHPYAACLIYEYRRDVNLVASAIEAVVQYGRSIGHGERIVKRPRRATRKERRT